MITFYNKTVVQEFTCLVGVCTIHGSVNTKLMDEAKKLKREFSPEFKEWFIQMKAKFDNGLSMHGDANDWWWKPAMRIQIPGVKFPGEEGYDV
mgnify:CR=1 FL=1